MSSSNSSEIQRFNEPWFHDLVGRVKKNLVYQGVHHIILDGTDSQGQQYNASVDLKIFEPDFYTKFYNNEEIIKSQKEEEKFWLEAKSSLNGPGS